MKRIPNGQVLEAYAETLLMLDPEISTEVIDVMYSQVYGGVFLRGVDSIRVNIWIL